MQIKAKQIITFLVLFLFIQNKNIAQNSYKSPKAIILTTGDGDGRGTISDGIVLALQSFNKQGIFTKLENREILLKPIELAKYTILIVSTIRGYHDYPSPNSLTNMSDVEMKNISNWVKNGGTLVAGNNIGRNWLNFKDRIEEEKSLYQNNWGLSDCLGIELKEKNMLNYHLEKSKLNIWKNNFYTKKEIFKWFLVPFKTNPNAEILSWWISEKDSIPGITLNKYGKGKSIFLPTFKLLHPIEDGGFSTREEIDKFYHFIVKTAIGKQINKIQISPWKDGYSTAFCWTFDDGGTVKQYQTIVNFVEKNKFPTLFFVTPDVGEQETKILKNSKQISLEGHSFSHPDFRTLSYFETKNEFLKNKNFWKKKFNGFRFPYVSNSFWGMYLMDEMDFKYETSIAVNHFDHIRGSVVPYNIPVFKDELYKTLNVLEISQIYNDDWFFYQKSLEVENYTKKMQNYDSKRFETYLKKYFNELVEPNNGVMVYLGHPMYSGISDITMNPLHEMASFLKTKNVWITTPTLVAERWNKLKNLEVTIEEAENLMKLKIETKSKIKCLSFKLNKKPEKVNYSGKHKIVEKEGTVYLVLDAEGEIEVGLEF